MDIHGNTVGGDPAWQDTYDEDVLVLMPRDAVTLFVYWGIRDIPGREGRISDGTPYLIRIYEHKDGLREKVIEFEVGSPAGDRYINVGAGSGKWSAELGAVDKGLFRPLFASGVIFSPESGPAGKGAVSGGEISSLSVPGC